MSHIMKRWRAAVCIALIAPLAGCGTLLYPERRGQIGGRLDVGVVVLDGIGLFFFLIPGIIAFAVDFSEGTIYLPGTARIAADGSDMRVARFDPRHATAATIETIVRNETGQRITLNQANMRVSRLESPAELRKRFAEALPGDNPMRVALNTQ